MILYTSHEWTVSTPVSFRSPSHSWNTQIISSVFQRARRLWLSSRSKLETRKTLDSKAFLAEAYTPTRSSSFVFWKDRTGLQKFLVPIRDKEAQERRKKKQRHFGRRGG